MRTGTPSPLAHCVRRHRLNAGLSQAALADLAGISPRTISDLERGQRLGAHLETLPTPWASMSTSGASCFC